MADDGNFDVGTEWAPIELGGVDITNGEFSITSRGNSEVFLTRRSTPPSFDNNGAYILSGVGSAAKYPLSVTEKLYAKTPQKRAIVGVIPI